MLIGRGAFKRRHGLEETERDVGIAADLQKKPLTQAEAGRNRAIFEYHGLHLVPGEQRQQRERNDAGDAAANQTDVVIEFVQSENGRFKIHSA